MKRHTLISMIIAWCPLAGFANNQDTAGAPETQIVPLLQYDQLNLDLQQVQSSSVGLYVEGKQATFIGLYTRHEFEQPLSFDYPQTYHTVDMLLDGKYPGYQYLGIFKSDSDQPVEGGINTFQAGVAVGREIIHRPGLSLVLGGGLAVGDFGLTTPEGEVWPIIPVPLVRWNYSTDFVTAKFEFLTSPNFSFTLYPKEKLRVIGDFRLDQMRDERDLIFECSLAYRFFSEDSTYGDFAGISLGIKNDGYGEFSLGGFHGDESLEMHYYALFASLDLSLLKFSVGYAFSGRELYRQSIKQQVGEGVYVSMQAMIPF